MTQPGYLADTAWVASPELINTRPNQYVGVQKLINFTVFRREGLVESSGGWRSPPSSFDWRPGWSRFSHSDPGYNSAGQVESRGLSLSDYLGQEYSGVIGEWEKGVGSPYCLTGCAYWDVYGRADYAYHVFRKFYETYYDYDVKWTGQWHTITDSRDQYFFEWVTKEEDVFGTVPNYAVVTKTVPITTQETRLICRAYSYLAVGQRNLGTSWTGCDPRW
jgi:hypothetical protein